MNGEAAHTLPRRTTRTRRTGRHRSPDRLSVPSAAPILVLGVPVEESAASVKIAESIASVAGTLCPGADIRAGFAGDGAAGLGSVLASAVRERADVPAEVCPFAAVVVPLAIAPDPGRDVTLAGVVAAAGPAVTLTSHLGPHPVLAAALHDRLAEAGLVQVRRFSGLSLVATSVGLLIGAVGGEPGLRGAETVAVLLTARLGIPVAPALLDDPATVERGIALLREAGASRFVLAPYVIGHEISARDLAAVAASLEADCAQPIGAHPSIGQLVTMRYGMALLQPRPA
ncbi:MAG TPA: hypothetical protein VGS62_01670 [Streptosporangiaceae bacterium]|nr:hypothetical protein [Streptosporangiaceae bacterium]